jgi:hypothetical protein
VGAVVAGVVPPVVVVGAAVVVVVVSAELITNEIEADVAETCRSLTEIVAVMVQVPLPTKVTTPVLLPIVQTDVVELV